MDRDLHSEQPNVGYLRTYRSKSDLAYSFNRAMGISMIAHHHGAPGILQLNLLQPYQHVK